MPELPEVETIKRSLAPRLLGRRIEDFQAIWPGAVHGITGERVRELVTGQVIGGLSRRGKYLLLELASGDRIVLHLRMTGQLLLKPVGSPLESHTRLVFNLSQGEELRFTDIRKFGGMDFLAAGCPEISGLRELGPEPLADAFTTDILKGILSGRKAPLKSVLLDQHSLAGVGNIYADEILHSSGFLPMIPACSLTEPEIAVLHAKIREVLAEGVSHRGTTKRNYVDGDGRPGEYQERLRVYGRAGKQCTFCEETIVRTVVGGRGTYYCPQCQGEQGSRNRKGKPIFRKVFAVPEQRE